MVYGGPKTSHRRNRLDYGPFQGVYGPNCGGWSMADGVIPERRLSVTCTPTRSGRAFVMAVRGRTATDWDEYRTLTLLHSRLDIRQKFPLTED